MLRAVSDFRRCGLLLVLLCVIRFGFAQQPWSAAESPTTQTLWGIASGDTLFVAVGEGGTILTSPDGVVWTTRASGTNRWLLAATWSPTVKSFVVVGDAGTILTSPDGITWTSRLSGTPQRLNSVAWSPKRFTNPDVFLAVGENGTAVVSYDLATWSPRATGDTGWLRGISSGLSDGFVITGHDGTILTTTDAGETFQRVASGTALHLDAVTRWGSDFFATGSNFVLTRSNFNATTWTLDRNLNTDGRENGIVYNGLVAFNNALVVVGDQGRILDEAGRPWATADPLYPGWRAVAASASRVVAVGTGGGIASAPLDPGIFLEHDLSLSFLSDRIILTARQRRRGTDGYRMQWTFNGEPIPGATQFELIIPVSSGATHGTYTFTARDSADRSYQTSITLEPQPNPAALGLVDLTFRPELSTEPGPLLPLADGRLYVTGQSATFNVSGRPTHGPVRLRADGTLDPAFAVADSVLSGTPLALVSQPDGRLVVLEQTGTTVPTFRVVRLNPNGSLDSTFRPDAALVASGYLPTLLADGRWVAVERRAVPESDGVNRNPYSFVAILRRFNADGSIDPGFVPVELLKDFTQNLSLQMRLVFTGPRCLSTRDALGRVYLGVQHGDFANSQAALNGSTRVIRLRADGTVDPAFSALAVEPLHALAATPNGLLARTCVETWGRLAPVTTTTQIFRLRADGTRDPTYRAQSLRTARGGHGLSDAGLAYDYDVLTALPDGALVARAVGHLGHFGFVRFDPEGNLDRNFNAEFGADTVSIQQIHPLANGQFLVAGSFRSLLGVAQPFLARITPNRTAAGVHLSNVSVRARTGASASVLIAGYVTQGGDTSVLARGAGPALSAFGVISPLADPRLGLYSGSALISTNDDWGGGPAEFLAATAVRLGAFPFPTGSTDAALYTTAPAAAYTVQISGKNNATGIALAELYHASPPPSTAASPRVINFSVRTRAGTGADTLIVGFTLAGDNTRNILLRAVGPTLSSFGVPDPLPDPVLTLYRGDRAIATNDNWAINSTLWLTLREAAQTVGAFPLPAEVFRDQTNSSKDAALLISLSPGSYTVQVTGKAGATGEALVELYEIP
jgi:uncharacterized delta-60 repeat protein